MHTAQPIELTYPEGVTLILQCQNQLQQHILIYNQCLSVWRKSHQYTGLDRNYLMAFVSNLVVVRCIVLQFQHKDVHMRHFHNSQTLVLLGLQGGSVSNVDLVCLIVSLHNLFFVH